MDGNGYQVTVQFADVLDLVPQSAVKVDDVTVGKVERIAVDGWTAKVTLHVDDSVHLPANATADARADQPAGGEVRRARRPRPTPRRKGSCAPGPSSRWLAPRRDPQVEDVLGALSLLLNGGGVGAAQGHHDRAQPGHPRQRVLDPRPGRPAGHLRRRPGRAEVPDREGARRGRPALRPAQRPEGRPGHRAGPPARRPEAARRPAQAADHDAQLARPARGRRAPGSSAASKDNTVADLKALQPTLTQLTRSGDDLPNSLRLLLSFPFPDDATQGAIKGDYANLHATARPQRRGAVEAERRRRSGPSGLSGLPSLPLPLPTPAGAAQPARACASRSYRAVPAAAPGRLRRSSASAPGCPDPSRC